MVNTNENTSLPNQQSFVQLPLAFDASGHQEYCSPEGQGGVAQQQSQMMGGYSHDQLEKRVLPSQSVLSSEQSCNIVNQTLRLNTPCYPHQQQSELVDATLTTDAICSIAPNMSSDTAYETISTLEAQSISTGPISAETYSGKPSSDRHPQSEAHLPITLSQKTFQNHVDHNGASHWSNQESVPILDLCVAHWRHQNQNYNNSQYQSNAYNIDCCSGSIHSHCSRAAPIIGTITSEVASTVVCRRTTGSVLRTDILLDGNTCQLESQFQILPAYLVVNRDFSDEMAVLPAAQT